MVANYALEGHTLDPDPDKTHYPAPIGRARARPSTPPTPLLGPASLTRATERELLGFSHARGRRTSRKLLRDPCARTRCGC